MIGSLRVADVFEQPPPRRGIPRLAGGGECSQVMRRSCFFGPDRRRDSSNARIERRRNSEHLDLMLRAEFPHAIRRRVIGRSVVDAYRRAVDESAVDQPRPHHPADVGVPTDPRAATDVSPERHVLRRLDRKTRMRVRDAFWFSGRAGCVEDDERVFGGSGFDFLCPPRCEGEDILARISKPSLNVLLGKQLFLVVLESFRRFLNDPGSTSDPPEFRVASFSTNFAFVYKDAFDRAYTPYRISSHR